MTDGERDWMLIGEVVGVFGLHGELKVLPLTDFPERFGGLKRAYFGPTHEARDLVSARFHKSHVLLKVRLIDNATAASELRGLEISVPRSESVVLPEGHYFLQDLVGVTLFTSEGEVIGNIAEVLRTGSNDVFVVGTGRQEILIPAIADAILEFDLERRRIVVESWALQDPI